MDLQRFVMHRRYWLVLLAVWAMVVAASYFASIREIRQQNLRVAVEGARTLFQSLVMTRMWNAEHGGVYARIDDNTKPNPYLTSPKRDVVTTDGDRLTLINPAYMTRMISELAGKNGGLVFHITSLKPLNPRNAPDAWESQALREFEAGLKERSEVVADPAGPPVLRYMAPLSTEARCLKCHAVQGYQVGDIRGGISIDQPYAPFVAAAGPSERRTLLNHAAVFAGVSALLVWLLEILRRRWRELHNKLDELGRAQVRMLQAEKMAAVGELAAGVAHHLNTPIGYVKSNLGTLRCYQDELQSLIDAYAALETEVDPGSGALAKVRAIKQGIDYGFLREDTGALLSESLTGLDRAGQIVGDLRAFARAGEVAWQWADVRAGLEVTLHLVDHLHPTHPEIVRDFGDVPAVWCIPAQLNQAFLSLLDNAIRATPADGRITLRTRHLADGRVAVECIDTGVGIEPDKIGHLIEPFYSERKDGQGTGMGLPLVYGIAREHGGELEIESSPGQGSTFRIILPIGLSEYG